MAVSHSTSNPGAVESADTGEREMENDQIEKPVSSAPVAAGLVDDDAERWRRQLYHVPTAAQKAERIEGIRRWNEKANGRELAEYKQRLAVFEENNRLLVAVGEAPVKFPATGDPRDLGCPALVTQINLLGRLINEQVDTLNRCEAEAAEAQWQAALAKETPIVRMLVRRVEALEAEKAERSERDRESVRAVPAVRPKPALSNMGVGLGDGLTPSLSAPIAPPGISPRRISR
jgi:hypothetical protein